MKHRRRSCKYGNPPGSLSCSACEAVTKFIKLQHRVLLFILYNASWFQFVFVWKTLHESKHRLCKHLNEDIDKRMTEVTVSSMNMNWSRKRRLQELDPSVLTLKRMHTHTNQQQATNVNNKPMQIWNFWSTIKLRNGSNIFSFFDKWIQTSSYSMHTQIVSNAAIKNINLQMANIK